MSIEAFFAFCNTTKHLQYLTVVQCTTVYWNISGEPTCCVLYTHTTVTGVCKCNGWWEKRLDWMDWIEFVWNNSRGWGSTKSALISKMACWHYVWMSLVRSSQMFKPSATITVSFLMYDCERGWNVGGLDDGFFYYLASHDDNMKHSYG